MWAFTAQHLHISYSLFIPLSPSRHATSPITLTTTAATTTTSNCALSHVDKLLSLTTFSSSSLSLHFAKTFQKKSLAAHAISAAQPAALSTPLDTWRSLYKSRWYGNLFGRRLCCCRLFLHTYAFMLHVCVFVFMVFSPWDKHRFVVTSNGGCDGILSGGVCTSERKRARRRRALGKAADGCKSTACHIKRDSFYEHTFFYSPSLSLLLLKPLFMCLLSADNLFRQGLAISAAVFFCSISCIFQHCDGIVWTYRDLSIALYAQIYCKLQNVKQNFILRQT